MDARVDKLEAQLTAAAEAIDAIHHSLAERDPVEAHIETLTARITELERDAAERKAAMETLTVEKFPEGIETLRAKIDDSQLQVQAKMHKALILNATLFDERTTKIESGCRIMWQKLENLAEDTINLKNETNTKCDTKVDTVAWKETNDVLDAEIKTARDMVHSLRRDVEARWRKLDDILATIRHDITAVETILKEPKDPEHKWHLFFDIFDLAALRAVSRRHVVPSFRLLVDATSPSFDSRAPFCVS